MQVKQFRFKSYTLPLNTTSVHLPIESIKTTSMEDVSTGVLEKIKNI